MTPTATVCFMSLTANLPRGGYSAKVSTHIDFIGNIWTMQASWFLISFGSASISLPVLLSIFESNFSNLQAICEVWQSRLGYIQLRFYLGG